MLPVARATIGSAFSGLASRLGKVAVGCSVAELRLLACELLHCPEDLPEAQDFGSFHAICSAASLIAMPRR
jgi:hypothetical protein